MFKYIGFGIIGLLAIFGIVNYNSMVSLDENINQTYSQVQNVMQRQADLIPNLVESVKGYAKHESETLTKVTEARSKLSAVSKLSPEQLAKDPELQKKLIEAQTSLNQAAISLNMVKEAYPQLQANDNFKYLMNELSGSQNRITVERRKNQLAVEQYNKAVRTFPRVVFAKTFGFENRPYFSASDNAQTTPKVNFQ